MGMKLYTGTVEGGAVRLPAQAGVREGAKVILAVVGDGDGDLDDAAHDAIEADEVAFVRACRGRLAGYLRDEER